MKTPWAKVKLFYYLPPWNADWKKDEQQHLEAKRPVAATSLLKDWCHGKGALLLSDEAQGSGIAITT